MSRDVRVFVAILLFVFGAAVGALLPRGSADGRAARAWTFEKALAVAMRAGVDAAGWLYDTTASASARVRDFTRRHVALVSASAKGLARGLRLPWARTPTAPHLAGLATAADPPPAATVTAMALVGSIDPVDPIAPTPPIAPPPPSASPPPVLRRRIMSSEEPRIARIIEAVFQEYFKSYEIGGESFVIRMPFGLNEEREDGRRYHQAFYRGAKGEPAQLWPHIDSVLGSREFARYVGALGRPGEKVIVFDLKKRSYSISTEKRLIEAMKSGPYPGTPTRILVYRSGPQLAEADIYNYLYAVAAVGVDCSGLVYNVLSRIALAYGMDLDQTLSQSWRLGPAVTRARIGLWFFDPANGYADPVGDRIEDLRPADVILFRGSDGAFKHSAIIQSIDLNEGLIRYVQSTDWAVQGDRGVHQSLIRFDPSRPQASLMHYSVRWMQEVRPPFEGETEPRDWVSDGDRYRWYTDAGGSLVVRSRILAALIIGRDPDYYTNRWTEERSATASSRERVRLPSRSSGGPP